MSYVLDALRRADAERHRGAVPHLHAQLQGPPDATTRDGPRAGWPLWALAAMAVLVVGLSAALAWTWWPVPSVVALQPPTPAGAGPAGAGPMSGPGPAVGHAAATPPRELRDLREPSPRAAPPMPVDRSPPPVARAAEPPPVPSPPPPGIVPASPARMAAAAAQARVPRRQDLPESVQRQLPTLVFGGATDSPAAASRMLIVNGQIFREGDEVSAGLVLEHIALRAARLRWRGQLFEVAY